MLKLHHVSFQTLQSLDGITSEVIHTSTFSGKLTYGDSYSNSYTYIVGSHLPAGQYNITLHVDYRHDIFEFDKKDNNIKSKVVTIYQALPDLAIESLSAVIASSPAGNDLHVNWTVVNNGPGRTLQMSWRDVVYVKSDGGSQFRDLVYNWNVDLNQPLTERNTYSVSQTINLPMKVYGNVVVTVHVDKYGRTADKNRSNNEMQKRGINVPLHTPDLELNQIDKVGTNEIYSGSTVRIRWKVTNIGVPVSQNSIWEEQLTLSSSFSSLTPRLAFTEIRHDVPLGTGDNYDSNTTLAIPDNVVGEMFLHVIIDPNNKVFEGPNKANNAKYISLNIQSPPSPDFTVIDVKAEIVQSTSIKQTFVSVSWTVKNIGNSMKVERRWKDSVYLSNNVHLTEATESQNLLFLKSFDVDASLQTQQVYKMSKSILLPENVVGNYYVYLMTDSNANIIELNGEDNNFAHTEQGIEITLPPSAKLSININSIGLENSASVVTGKESWIAFTVANTGDAGTIVTSWQDVVYLMNFPNADKEAVLQNGIKLATIGHLGSLRPSDSYNVNATFTFPNDFSGDAYLYVFTLSGVDGAIEPGTAGHQTSSKFTVTVGKRPNLVPILDSTVSEQNGGEPYVLEYNVTNKGEADASESRFDAVFLSDDIVLDPFDKRLVTQTTSTSMKVNDTTSESVSVFLPFDLESKNYVLILVVDIRNDIHESNEQDNTAWKTLNIRERVSTDIAVVDVSAPTDATFGDKMDITWKLRNLGQRQAKGYKCDTAYISNDKEWDISDEQVGSTVCGYITIDPFTSASDDKAGSIRASVPLVPDDSYTAIVKSRSNILDNYLENNVGYNNITTHISLAKLELEKSEIFSLQRNEEKAYRIPDVPAEETLIVRITSNNQNNFNDLRIRFNKPATKYEFDATTSDPFLSSQYLVLPNTKYGDYYVLVGYTGSTSANPSMSQVTIEAKLAKFEILNTSPSKAAPLGHLTLKCEGTLLPEDVKVSLANKDKDIYAKEVFRFSSTMAWATFDLKQTSVGEMYSVTLSSEYLNLTTSLSDILEIVDGTPGRGKASLSLPAALRPGERGLVYVDIQNEGDSDMIAPIIVVTTNAVGHLKLITNLKNTEYQKRHVLLASPTEGPAGILPPKAYSRLIFDAKQIDTDVIGRVLISVSIIEPSATQEHDYIKLKDTLKFTHYGAEAWDKVWNNFISNVGSSWFTLSKKVSTIANQMSLAGRRVHELSDFVTFLLDMSDAPKGDSYITKVTDLFVEINESPQVTLEITRYVSPKIGLRSMSGFLGQGWVVTHW